MPIPLTVKLDVAYTFYQWVLKHENSLVWHREVLGWINKYSGIEDEQRLAEQVGGLKVE